MTKHSPFFALHQMRVTSKIKKISFSNILLLKIYLYGSASVDIFINIIYFVKVTGISCYANRIDIVQGAFFFFL